MIGYKAFDQNLCCRGFQYEVGKTYTKPTKKEELRMCSDNAFHFCRELFAIEKCSNYKLSESRICEVIAGDIIHDDEKEKYCTNSITILREIVGDERLELINSGNHNSGDWNSGNHNSGNWNSGYCNSGYWNSGNHNSGNWNSGDCNSGYCNSGNWNSGNHNSGNWNSGYCNSGNWNSGNHNSGNWNSGYCNSGYCNSDRPPIRIFNQYTDVEEINFPNFFYFDMTIFVSYDTATDDERKQHKKDIEVCGGFLKTIPYKEAWRRSWDKATDEDRRKVLQLPNWNNEIFKEISGIDVELELGLKAEEGGGK